MRAEQFKKDGYLLCEKPTNDYADIKYLRDRVTELTDPGKFNNVINICDKEAILEELLTGKLLREVRSILGTDISLWSAVFWIKPANATGGELCWHQDTMYWQDDWDNKRSLFKDRQYMETVTAWIAIDDISELNAGMKLLPGSHVGMYNLSDMYALDKLITGIEAKIVQSKLNAGEYILFHENLFHYSPVNNSNFRRAAAILRFCPNHLINKESEIIDPFVMHPPKII